MIRPGVAVNLQIQMDKRIPMATQELLGIGNGRKFNESFEQLCTWLGRTFWASLLYGHYNVEEGWLTELNVPTAQYPTKIRRYNPFRQDSFRYRQTMNGLYVTDEVDASMFIPPVETEQVPALTLDEMIAAETEEDPGDDENP